MWATSYPLAADPTTISLTRIWRCRPDKVELVIAMATPPPPPARRHGRLEPGGRIVLVVTAAASRGPALAACEFLIDWLKTKAPFWKLEETADGEQWVDAREADGAAAEKWGE